MNIYIFENKSYNSLLSKTYKKIKEEDIKYEDFLENKEKKINLENFKFMLAKKMNLTKK